MLGMFNAIYNAFINTLKFIENISGPKMEQDLVI